MTADKRVRLQNYFRGAILSNLDSEENMRNAIWASFCHSTSTDEDPHHLHCPEGEESWAGIHEGPLSLLKGP